MNVYERFHNASHLAATTGVLLYAVSAGAPVVGFLGLLFVLLAWGMFSRRVTSPVPRAVINTGLLLASAYMFLRMANAPINGMITILAEYLGVLLLIKLFERRTPRDQSQSLAIAGMLGVGAVLTDPGLFTGTLLVTHAFVLLVAATRFQVWAGHHATFARNDRASETSIEATPAAGKNTARRLRAANVLLAFGIGLGGVGVFVALPRQAEMRGVTLDFFGSGSTTVSGFRDHVQLGAPGLITLSREIVGYAELEFDGIPLTQQVSRYFRGAVLDEYTDDGNWRRSTAMRAFDDNRLLTLGQQTDDSFGAHLDRGRDELPDLEAANQRGRFPDGVLVIDQRMELVNKTSPNLFALAHPIQVAFRSPAPIELNPIDGTLTLDGRPNRQRYQVRSATNFTRAGTPEELAEYRRLREETRALDGRTDPFTGGRVGDTLRAIATGLMDDAGMERAFNDAPSTDDGRIVRLFERHLRTRYDYTLEMVAPESRAKDPTLYFLQESRRGHCEYFASALAGLCRAVGIEARVVTGFVTSEVSPVDSRYVIRQSHAHAWVEAPVVDSTTGLVVWETFDASPAVGEEQPTSTSGAFVAMLRTWLYTVEDLWVNAVVGYDAEAQQSLIGVSGDDQVNTLADWMNRVTAPDSGALGGAPDWVRRLGPIGLAIAGCVLIFFALRGVRPGARRSKSRDRRTKRSASRIDRALRRLGCERPGHLPLLAHASACADDGVSRALHRAARALYAERFADAQNTEELEDAIGALERLAKERGR